MADQKDFTALANRRASKEAKGKSQTPKPQPKPNREERGKPRRATYNFYSSDDDELARLSKLFIDAGIAPRRIEESKVIRATLSLAFTEDVTPEKLAATYKALMAADGRRTRKP